MLKLFIKCITFTNEEHIDTAEEINITMPMNNLIQYSDYYSDAQEIYGSLRKTNRQ